MISSSRILISLYYFLDGSYHYEQKGTLLGIHHYLRETNLSDGSPIYQLIRNIHRLEKGLSVKGEYRRSFFAESYIIETVESFAKIHRGQNAPSMYFTETKTWASDVLKQYFRTVEKTENIQKAEKRFQEIVDFDPEEHKNRFPVKRKFKEYSKVQYGELKQLALQRRSVRSYQSIPVPRKELDKAIQIAALSPSACNRQAFKFMVFDDPQWVEEICQILPGIDCQQGDIPCVVGVVGNQGAYFDERDRHLIYIDGSLAVMSFQLALETLGLSSCCINWPSIFQLEKRMEKLLGLEEHERVVMFLSVGYPDPEGLIPYSQKKSVDEIRSYNNCQGAR